MILIYLVILVAAFWFLIVRPQRRQAMIRRQLLAAVGVGDEIVTSGGIYGTVLAIDDDTLDVEIADGIVITLARGAVAAKVPAPAEYEPELEDDPEIEDMGDEPEIEEAEVVEHPDQPSDHWQADDVVDVVYHESPDDSGEPDETEERGPRS